MAEEFNIEYLGGGAGSDTCFDNLTVSGFDRNFRGRVMNWVQSNPTP